MTLKKEKKSAAGAVAPIRNDYVRSKERQEKRQQAHKVRLFRRLTVFGILVLMAAIWIVVTLYGQSQMIAEKERQQEEALAALAEIEAEQGILQEQIMLLNDDEYIAKLARKEYFLSEDGELIFTLPEEGAKKDEKEPSS